MLALSQATLNHAWDHQMFRMTCVMTLSIADFSKTFKQVNIRKAIQITRMHPQSMSWPAGKCLHWHFQPLPDPVSNTYMFQADHHSPCTQECQGNLSKWLMPRSTHICSHEMLWKAGHGSHQHQYPRQSGPIPIHIQPQQIIDDALPFPTWTNGTPMWECCSLTIAQRSTPWCPPSSSLS